MGNCSEGLPGPSGTFPDGRRLTGVSPQPGRPQPHRLALSREARVQGAWLPYAGSLLQPRTFSADLSGWGGKGPGQSPIHSSDLASLLPQEAQGGEAGNRWRCALTPQIQNTAQPRARLPLLWAQEGTGWGRALARLSLPARSAPQPQALCSDPEGGGDRELRMKSSDIAGPRGGGERGQRGRVGGWGRAGAQLWLLSSISQA